MSHDERLTPEEKVLKYKALLVEVEEIKGDCDVIERESKRLLQLMSRKTDRMKEILREVEGLWR